MAMLTTPTQIPFYSPTRNAMYVIVKPAPRNPCYTDEHASAAAPEGLLGPCEGPADGEEGEEVGEVVSKEAVERYPWVLGGGVTGCREFSEGLQRGVWSLGV
jgi:hypothetical protein